MRAYVEIKVEAGRDVLEVVERLRKTEGVKEAYAVTGHCDVIAEVEAPDFKGIVEIVTKRIHALKGVVSTETLLCVE
jgi:DNA-binding Lrp family transcriptional regulator